MKAREAVRLLGLNGVGGDELCDELTALRGTCFSTIFHGSCALCPDRDFL